MAMRVAPPSLNYDSVLPLAISSRANRRTFQSTNGATFSNATGATICKVQINADSMLDAGHSYLQVQLNNTSAVADMNLIPEIGPAFIQRLVISSGGVVIEDINEYGRLYANMMLQQTSEDYCRNVCGGYGLVPSLTSSCAAGDAVSGPMLGTGAGWSATLTATGAAAVVAQTELATGINTDGEIYYTPTLQTACAGVEPTTGVNNAGAAANRPDAGGVAKYQQCGSIAPGTGRIITIPLLSGFLNNSKLIPLIMMNAGFEIEVHLASNNKVGCSGTQQVSENAGALVDTSYSLTNVQYVAQLIDLDASFYGKLREVMSASGGAIQLAGQSYRHYAGQLGAAASEYTITLPARVKSIKSIFNTFIDTTQSNSNTCWGTSVFQNAAITSYRFEIGSVRYPQSDVNTAPGQRNETTAELHKAFGRLGDYSHSSSVRPKHLENVETLREPLNIDACGLSGFCIGQDFESFQRVALESGINTADRSLPVNFICRKGATANTTNMDSWVLSDAIYFVNSDGTLNVSV